jgi:hypothetical protein
MMVIPGPADCPSRTVRSSPLLGNWPRASRSIACKGMASDHSAIRPSCPFQCVATRLCTAFGTGLNSSVPIVSPRISVLA